MPYSLRDHRIRFATWAAARAAQRGFTSVKNLAAALHAARVPEELFDKPATLFVSATQYDDLHRTWCRAIIDNLAGRGIKEVTYGRAAKLVAVFVKSTIVLGGLDDTALAQVAHPPIDRDLLKSLARTLAPRARRKLAGINWTRLDESSYFKLIGELRRCLPEGAPFWVLEQHWNVTTEEAL